MQIDFHHDGVVQRQFFAANQLFMLILFQDIIDELPDVEGNLSEQYQCAMGIDSCIGEVFMALTRGILSVILCLLIFNKSQ